jgi:hypothetical protein
MRRLVLRQVMMRKVTRERSTEKECLFSSHLACFLMIQFCGDADLCFSFPNCWLLLVALDSICCFTLTCVFPIQTAGSLCCPGFYLLFHLA